LINQYIQPTEILVSAPYGWVAVAVSTRYRERTA
jgi:hypothetical protein